MTKYTDTRELLEKRAKLFTDARGILDRAEKDGRRSLTVEERAEVDTLTTEAKRTSLNLAEHESRNEKARREAADWCAGRGPDNAGGTGSWRFIDAETGDEHRSLLHTESVSTALGFETQENPVSAGDLIVGAAVNRWRNEETRAAYGEASSAAGGFLMTPEMSATVIDLARARSVMSQAGVQTMVMGAEELLVAKVETDPTAYWTAEHAEITKSTGTFGQIKLRARTIAVYCEASLELMRDAPNAGSIIENTITNALALGLDSTCLNGPGGAGVEPCGLLNDPDVDSVDCGADILKMDDFLTGLGKLWANNVEAESLILSVEGRLQVARMKDGEGRYLPWHDDLAPLTKLSTSAIESAANYNSYIGYFGNALLGLRSPIEIEMSGVAGDLFKKKQVGIRGLLRCDFAVGRANDVVQIKNFTVT